MNRLIRRDPLDFQMVLFFPYSVTWSKFILVYENKHKRIVIVNFTDHKLYFTKFNEKIQSVNYPHLKIASQSLFKFRWIFTAASNVTHHQKVYIFPSEEENTVFFPHGHITADAIANRFLAALLPEKIKSWWFTARQKWLNLILSKNGAILNIWRHQ